MIFMVQEQRRFECTACNFIIIYIMALYKWWDYIV